MYFALAATLPSAAGLGGGGVCVAFDARASRGDAIEFLSRAPSRPAPAGAIAIATPGNVRGMAAVHARYGNLRWEQLVRPGEQIARFGIPTPRALAADLARAGARLGADPAAGAIFARREGRLLNEGDDLTQLDLAVALGQIRAQGAGEFYGGALARRMAEGAALSGLWLSAEDLQGYRPSYVEPQTAAFGDHTVYFPPASVAGSRIAAELWRLLGDQGQYRRAPSGERERVFAEVTGRLYAAVAPAAPDRLGGPVDDAATGFAAMDRSGAAIACSVTMNAPFGSGRMIRGTGILGAEPGLGARSLAPMIVANRPTREAVYAAAAGGNSAAPTALIGVALKTLIDQRSLVDALAASRSHPGAGGAANFTEGGANAAAALGRVNSIYCAEGARSATRRCVVRADPRGHGLGADAGT